MHYIYIYIYIRGNFDKFPYFSCTGILNWRRHLKIQYVIAIHVRMWLINFYNFRFQSTATAAIGIHHAKAWLSQLVNFKNAIWTWGHFRRTIKCHRNVWDASDCCSTILHESSIRFFGGIRNLRNAGSPWGIMAGVGGVRKSELYIWLAKGLGLLCWSFKGVREDIPSEEASTLQIW